MGVSIKLTSKIPEITAEMRAKASILVQATAFVV